jgi:hypothetical protein
MFGVRRNASTTRDVNWPCARSEKRTHPSPQLVFAPHGSRPQSRARGAARSHASSQVTPRLLNTAATRSHSIPAPNTTARWTATCRTLPRQPRRSSPRSCSINRAELAPSSSLPPPVLAVCPFTAIAGRRDATQRCDGSWPPSSRSRTITNLSVPPRPLCLLRFLGLFFLSFPDDVVDNPYRLRPPALRIIQNGHGR